MHSRWAAFWLFCVFATPVLAQEEPGADVGLVTSLAGKVTYLEGDKQLPLEEFSKIRQGDKLNLAGASSLTVVFFANGRKEAWQGPVSLLLGKSEAMPTDQPEKPGEAVTPSISKIPGEISARLKRIPALLKRTHNRSYGGILFRGKKTGDKPGNFALNSLEKLALAQARKECGELISKSPPDDPTPRLLLLAILADYGQFADMTQALAESVILFPNCKSLEDIARWLSPPAPSK